MRQAAGVSESPYAVPVEDLVASARVDVAHQVEEQAEPRLVPADWTPVLYADGMGGDADGD
jgi:hypothetical protein